MLKLIIIFCPFSLLLLKYFPEDFFLLYILCFYWSFTQLQILFKPQGVQTDPRWNIWYIWYYQPSHHPITYQFHKFITPFPPNDACLKILYDSHNTLFPHHFAQNFHKSNYAILVFSGRISPKCFICKMSNPLHKCGPTLIYNIAMVWINL